MGILLHDDQCNAGFAWGRLGVRRCAFGKRTHRKPYAERIRRDRRMRLQKGPTLEAGCQTYEELTTHNAVEVALVSNP